MRNYLLILFAFAFAPASLYAQMFGGQLKSAKVGSITALNCGSATNNGTLTSGTAASSVSSSVTYTGGNGGTHNGQTVTSTGVTGLTATLASGSFANAAGILTYTISGTPNSSGSASFLINIGGQSCILNITVGSNNTPASCGANNVHNPNLTYGSMTDQDGNVYKTIQIGNQEWMAENLKASHYRNGDLIPVVTNNISWYSLNSGASCWLNNDSATYNCPYGKLYNWYAFADNRHVCPTGWHEPSYAEWDTLIGYIDPSAALFPIGVQSYIAAGKMKSTGTQYWLSPNTAADNSSGFSGLPGGNRLETSSYGNIGTLGIWWSSQVYSTYNAYVQSIFYQNSLSGWGNRDKRSGLSVRCLSDDTYPQGSINTIDCSSATNNGTLTSGTVASGVSSIVPYTGGNGGAHNGQTVNSTGVTGLTATLAAGTFANGAGSLTYTITGTPASSGTASFALSIGGQSCTLTRTVGLPAGSITALNCGSATNNGTLTSGIVANGVSSIIPYTGGNGGTHNGQTVTSTGVTGLTATLASGSFANAAGILTYTISGTPNSSGSASFLINIGGQSCILNITVGSNNTPASCGANNVHNPNLTYGSMTDQDGNVYKTIQIGNQEWMAENLKASHYRNGDVIPVVTNNAIWDSIWSYLTTGASCWYNNDSTINNCPYGKLYNWNAAADARNICPTGWHVPTDSEWSTLTTFLGGDPVAGGKMKSTGTQYWQSPNTDATNESGFSGLPGGNRNFSGPFNGVGYQCSWWSSTEYNTYNAWYRNLNFNNGSVGRSGASKGQGFSVRCLRDVSSPQGSINTIDCSSATNNGTLTSGTVASGVSSIVPYTGGNGGAHNGQTVTSTGVTGLTATLAAGTFANGAGSLTYTISGTPSASGTASFALNIGGQSCTLTRTVGLPAGSITSLSCATATNSGTLTSGTVASGVSSLVPYTGGNGGAHNGQTVISTVVTGLTATLAAGSFANGAGSLTYTISGTPSASGTASFALNIGGQSCNLNLTVNNAGGSGTYPPNSVFCTGTPTVIVDVTNPATGRIWMDRNLGATQAATGSTDANAYGDLYQWGRRSDGHQCRNSPTLSTLSSSDQPAHGSFIRAFNSPYDWRSPQNDNLWQGVNGVNNPCPSGYRLPTEAEFETERLSWSINNKQGAFASALKLPVAGGRSRSDGSLFDVGSNGSYWSSTVSGFSSRYLSFYSSSANMSGDLRAYGYSVRCLKD